MNFLLNLYSFTARATTPALKILLQYRVGQRKENPKRIPERFGIPGKSRPDGPLLWFHAASVGEAQSALILIERISSRNKDLKILVTTGTLTSAALMERRLPSTAFHQFYPLDHPSWVNRFLDCWKPDLVFWMESELWPSMLVALKRRNTPVILINARLSPKSRRWWQLLKNSAKNILETFALVLAQTEDEADAFRSLGASRVLATDNLKYAAAPLACDEADLAALKNAAAGRPLWLYASTHKGEEEIACETHKALQACFPDLLTVIVPRHPSRGPEIESLVQQQGLTGLRRSDGIRKNLPCLRDQIYIADTLGELGLFYRLSPVACIGRSFSDDGGGGHNPIEAARLGCAVLHGPLVQNLMPIYREMGEAGAATALSTPKDLIRWLEKFLESEEKLKQFRERGKAFACSKEKTVDVIVDYLDPFLAPLLRHQENGRSACG